MTFKITVTAVISLKQLSEYKINGFNKSQLLVV